VSGRAAQRSRTSGDAEVGLLRLVAQRLAGPPAATPAEAVRHLTAMQAQDQPGALLAIALRTAGRSREEVLAAFDAGEIVRSWPMRGTLHVLAAEDLGWMLALGTPRPRAAAALRRTQLGLTDADVERAEELARPAVPIPRAGLTAVWEEGGLAPAGGRGYHLLNELAHRGVLCFGPTVDGEPAVVAVDDWIRAPRRLERDEALGEWARRYFLSHGPASVADLARWTGVPAADVRTAVALARPHLTTMDVDGVEHLLDPALPDRLAEHRRAARGVHLLPGFDEFVLGYGRRDDVLDPAFADRIVPGGNGIFRPTVVVGGRVVGTWRLVRKRLEVDAFRPLAARTATAVERAHARLP
jgi:hypothetical protein